MARRRLQTLSLVFAGLCVVGTFFFWSGLLAAASMLNTLFQLPGAASVALWME